VAEAPDEAAIVILTHDHALDYRLTRAALQRPGAGFIGLIGSATKRARFVSRLAADGLDAGAPGRLTCPIGVDGITGKEPDVIAIAVLAQLLRLPQHVQKKQRKFRYLGKLHAFRGEILSVGDDPLHAPDAVCHQADGLLVVEDGIVVARGDHAALAARFAEVPVTPIAGLIVPGFIDAHVHYPQMDRIASHGEQLLDWLERTSSRPKRLLPIAAMPMPWRRRFSPNCCATGPRLPGVPTVHEGSVDALFEAALARNLRLASGKVLMDLGPEGLRDSVATARAETEALIARWHGRGRLSYAITPRFALTSSDEQLALAGSCWPPMATCCCTRTLRKTATNAPPLPRAFPRRRTISTSTIALAWWESAACLPMAST
jgi:hypothetical protein